MKTCPFCGEDRKADDKGFMCGLCREGARSDWEHIRRDGLLRFVVDSARHFIHEATRVD